MSLAREGDATALSGASLVVAADSARARLFASVTPDAPLREFDDLANPEARLHEGDLVADATGRNGRGLREGGHSALGGDSMKRHRAEDFAGAVSDKVLSALRESRAERVYVLAEPEFLGLLRKRFDAQVRNKVAGEVAKSLAGESAERIRAALPERL